MSWTIRSPAGPTIYGAHVSRAARIEPITPEGCVYVTETFAAVLALHNADQFSCDYVGITDMAKRLRPAPHVPAPPRPRRQRPSRAGRYRARGVAMSGARNARELIEIQRQGELFPQRRPHIDAATVNGEIIGQTVHSQRGISDIFRSQAERSEVIGEHTADTTKRPTLIP